MSTYGIRDTLAKKTKNQKQKRASKCKQVSEAERVAILHTSLVLCTREFWLNGKNWKNVNIGGGAQGLC